MKRKKLVSNNPSQKALENCSHKSWYKTEEEAKEAASQRMFDNMSADLGVYQCNICRNWHLTSVKDK